MLGEPSDGLSEFDNLQHVPADSVLDLPAEQPGRYHEVQPGESLSSIAGNYQTSVEALFEANGLTRDSVLQPGQWIFVPNGR